MERQEREMKESDSVTKWCPMARSVVDAAGYASGNRFGGDTNHDQDCLCIGSACMLWESWEYVNGDRQIVNKKEGDCGLKSKEGVFRE